MTKRHKTILRASTLALFAVLLFSAQVSLGQSIAYTQSTDTFEITGGTEGSPAGFPDLAQADLDGTLVLLDAHVISADPEDVPLTQGVRAADSLALPLNIMVNANRVGATADIIGRDHLGNSISETGLDISAADAGDGVELVTDGDMTVPGSWTANGTWVIGSGVATVTGDGTNHTLTQDFAYVVGGLYRWEYEIISNTLNAGLFFLSSSSMVGASVAIPATVGTHVLYLQSNNTGTGTAIRFLIGPATTSGDLVLDNVSVQLAQGVQTANKYSQISTLGITYNGLTAGDEVTVTQDRLGVLNAGKEPDLIVNGGFYEDADWTKGTGWTIGSNVASSDGSQSAASLLSQASLVVIDDVYKVVFTVSAYSAGSVTAEAGSSGSGTERSANGTYTENVTAAGSTTFAISADADFIGSIDNVSVRKLTGQYNISCDLDIGDGSTSTFFSAAGTIASFESGNGVTVKAGATLERSSIAVPFDFLTQYPTNKALRLPRPRRHGN